MRYCSGQPAVRTSSGLPAAARWSTQSRSVLDAAASRGGPRSTKREQEQEQEQEQRVPDGHLGPGRARACCLSRADARFCAGQERCKMELACEGDLIQPGGARDLCGLSASAANGGSKIRVDRRKDFNRALRPTVLYFRTECYATAAHLSSLGAAAILEPPPPHPRC